MKNAAGKNYKILERKSSKFGSVGVWDRGNELERLVTRTGKAMSYYDNLKRLEIYETALDRYQHDQLARPIINMIVHAIFSDPPEFQGDEDLVERANKVIRDSEIDWTDWGVDLELHGDMFIQSFLGKIGTAKIASIPAHSIEINYDEKNILDVRGYWHGRNVDIATAKSIPPDEMSHIKINNASNMVYGSATLRAVFWWLDVLDNLWERNWIRGSNYYGSPIVAVTGVPASHIATVKAALQSEAQRPGRNWVFPENVNVNTLDFTRNYPIEQLIDRVYQYILAACGIPQHLIYESNSSRGVAMFSADGFEMMIKARQRSWALGLIRAMRIIFEDEKLWNDESEFKVHWTPVFMRDMDKLSELMDMAIGNNLLSRQTAREWLSVKHSQEKERIEQQEEDEPIPPEVVPPTET